MVPPGPGESLWEIHEALPIGQLDVDFLRFIEELEARFASTSRSVSASHTEARAIAVHVTTGARDEPHPEQSLAELRELALTASVDIVETVTQKRRHVDPRFVLGRGKLNELMLASMQQEVDLVIFDRNLSPAQARSIADVVELKVIDRTQLILDIFAQRATTRDGKLQVELAQLKYTLPRLAGRSTAMSRLAGGIGGRGPGETKLEVDRRRAKERIHRLQKQIKTLSKQRHARRRRRTRSRVPIAAIVGYTNAGKSTLLNALTGSQVLAEDKLFATLDPTTRRLRFPDERELVLTDTVGFIRDLPEDLIAAFKATLEELSDAQLLIHVVDIATPDWEARVAAVERILTELDVHHTPQLLVFNKADLVADKGYLRTLARVHDATALSAHDPASIKPLSQTLCKILDTQLKPWHELTPEPEVARDQG